jgi:REP element-mobilizing transposase RayT
VALSALGRIVEDEWKRTGQLRPVLVEPFVVMPNHFHAIVRVGGSRSTYGNRSGASIVPLSGGGKRRESQALGSLVAGFKAAVTSRAWRELEWRGPVWQRSYHEHIIRGEADLVRISDYVDNNPLKWADDRYYSGST